MINRQVGKCQRQGDAGCTEKVRRCLGDGQPQGKGGGGGGSGGGGPNFFSLVASCGADHRSRPRRSWRGRLKEPRDEGGRREGGNHKFGSGLGDFIKKDGRSAQLTWSLGDEQTRSRWRRM